ncbi:hypothetical protein M432DRAFT_320765 [Thermoascus aurantiacus ATCC 26904]
MGRRPRSGVTWFGDGYIGSTVSFDDPRQSMPIRNTIDTPSAERAQQAVATVGPYAHREIAALEELTRAGCSCTPTLLARKNERQGSHMWIPGGLMVYILMEKLPGVCLDTFFSLDRAERDGVRRSFQEAWEECRARGVIPKDRGSQNLLWHRAARKCYIVDFERWRRAKPTDEWDDSEYPLWDLAYWRVGDGRGAMEL